MNKIIFLTLFLLFVLPSSASEQKIKIVVNDLIDQNKAISSTGIAITNAIRLRLSLEERIEIIDLDVSHQNAIKLRSEIDSVKELSVQYLITGNYREIEGDLSLHINVYSATSHQSYFFSPKPFNAKELFNSLEFITHDLVNTMYMNAGGVNIKTAGLVCFKSNEEDENIRLFVEKLQYAVFYNMPNNYNVLRPSTTENYCNEEELSDISSFLPETNILITASIKHIDDLTFIKPLFYISDLDKYFTPLPYEINFSNGYSYDLTEDFTSYLNKALQSILFADGTWNTELINSKKSGKYRNLISELELRMKKDSLSDYTSVLLAKKAMNMKPNKAEPYFYYGLILQNQNDLLNAVKYYEKAIEKYPEFEKTYRLLGQLLFDMGQYSRAQTIFSSASAKFDNPHFRYKLGVNYYFQDSLEKSIEVLESNSFPAESQQEINYYLGESYYLLGSQFYYEDYEKAIPFLEQALDYSNNKYRILRMLISAQNNLELYDENEKLIKESMDKGWVSANFYFDQIENLRNMRADGKLNKLALKEAIKYLHIYQDAIDTSTFATYQLLGITHFDLYQLDSAVYYYNKALELNPSAIANRLNLSEAALMNGDYEIAETTLVNSLHEEFYGVMSKGHEVIVHYLLCIKHILNDENYQVDIANIEELHIDENNKYRNWSFDTFLSWLDSQNLEKSTKKDIKRLSDKVKFKLHYNSDEIR